MEIQQDETKPKAVRCVHFWATIKTLSITVGSHEMNNEAPDIVVASDHLSLLQLAPTFGKRLKYSKLRTSSTKK